MNETQRRPWWRLHAATWIVAFTTSVAFVILNAMASDSRLMATFIEFHHGWPLTFVSRTVINDMPSLEAFGNELSIWLWTGGSLRFRFLGCAVDLLAAATLVVAMARVTERLARKLWPTSQFSMKFLLSAIAFVCGYLSLVYQQHDSEWIIVAMTICFTFVPLSFAALAATILELFSTRWRQLRPSKNPPIDI